MNGETLLFGLFGGLALGSATGAVTARSAAAGAICLGVAMLALAGVAVLLEAHFLAVFWILVFAAGVGVRLVFALMWLGPRPDVFLPPRPAAAFIRAAAAGVGVALLAVWLQSAAGLRAGSRVEGVASDASPMGFGGYRVLGEALFGDYLVPLETAGLLLLAAVVGGVALSRTRAS